MFFEVLHGHCGKVKELIGHFVSSAKVGCLFDVG